MFNLGPGELIVILLVALIIFGPRKLPELGKSLGAGLREFRKSTQGLKDELESSLKEPTVPPAPAPVRTISNAVSAEPSIQPQPVPAQAVTPASVNPQAVTPAPRTDDT